MNILKHINYYTYILFCLKTISIKKYYKMRNLNEKVHGRKGIGKQKNNNVVVS